MYFDKVPANDNNKPELDGPKPGGHAVPVAKNDVVIADPPWPYYSQQDKSGAAADHYPTMSDEELLAFNIRERFMTDRSILFMWATGPRLDCAIRCLDVWGLHYEGLSFVWVETRSDGFPIGAQGPRPAIVKSMAETEHSRKPDDVHKAIERTYPTASKLELFARRARPGWACWGNQAPQAANDDGAPPTDAVA